MNVKFQRNYYNDVILYAGSSNTKTLPFHISRLQGEVLRKLIKLSQKNPKITYSNEYIGRMCHISAGTIKDAIVALKNAHFIKNFLTHISDGDVIKTVRTINIKWEKIEEIFNMIPDVFADLKEEQLNEEMNETPQPETQAIQVKDEFPTVAVTTVDTPKVITPTITQPEPKEQTITTPQPKNQEMKLSEVEARAIINYVTEKFGDSITIDEYSELVPLLNDGKITNNYQAELYCNRIIKEKKDNSSSEKNRLYQVLESKKNAIGEINYAILKEQIKNNTITKLAALLQEIKFRTIPGNSVQESTPAVSTPLQPEAKDEVINPAPVIQMESVVEVKDELSTTQVIEAPVITMKSNPFPAPTPDLENEDEMTREKRLLSHLGVQRSRIGDDYYFKVAGNIYLKKYVNIAQVDWAIEDLLANPPVKWGQVKSSKRKY